MSLEKIIAPPGNVNQIVSYITMQMKPVFSTRAKILNS